MINYIREFLRKFDYPKDAEEGLLFAYLKIADNVLFNTLLDEYYLSEDLFEKLNTISGEVHEYTIHLLYFICLSQKTEQLYKEKNIPIEIFHDTMLDLRYKLVECIKYHGIYGTFVGTWFIKFFDLTRFALGRFQFEAIEMSVDYEKNGVKVNKGDTVLNVHIPASGRMPKEAIVDSYKRAADFFSHLFVDRPTIFVCSSWILFPKHYEFLPKESNILKFMEDYDIISEKEDPKMSNLWRFFGKEYNGDFNAMPTDNSLRKAYVDWLKAGNKVGTGFGIYIYKD